MKKDLLHLEALNKEFTVGKEGVAKLTLYKDDPRNFNGAVISIFIIKFDDGGTAELSTNDYYVVDK